jgi:outer membrane protein OmpA-like peptidoglycan-associated protein
LVRLSDEDKGYEKDRLLNRVSQKRLDFEGNSSCLNDRDLEVLRNVVEVLLEYPEVDLVFEGHAAVCSSSNWKRQDRELALSLERANTCKEQVLELGVVSNVGSVSLGVQEKLHYGCVMCTPVQTKLLNVQQRVDLILSRAGMEFLTPGSAQLCSQGLRTVSILARALKETPNRMSLLVPQTHNAIARARGEAIADAIREHGMINEINVVTTYTRNRQASLQIEGFEEFDPQAEEVRRVQRELIALLKETPLAFHVNSSELLPDVRPVVSRCAEILKGVRDVSLVVEAYSGSYNPKFESKANVKELMKKRAHRIVDWFHAEGVMAPLHARGYVAPCEDGGSPSQCPCVVLTVVNMASSDLDGLSDEDEPANCCLDGHECC